MNDTYSFLEQRLNGTSNRSFDSESRPENGIGAEPGLLTIVSSVDHNQMLTADQIPSSVIEGTFCGAFHDAAESMSCAMPINDRGDEGDAVEKFRASALFQPPEEESIRAALSQSQSLSDDSNSVVDGNEPMIAAEEKDFEGMDRNSSNFNPSEVTPPSSPFAGRMEPSSAPTTCEGVEVRARTNRKLSVAERARLDADIDRGVFKHSYSSERMNQILQEVKSRSSFNIRSSSFDESRFQVELPKPRIQYQYISHKADKSAHYLKQSQNMSDSPVMDCDPLPLMPNLPNACSTSFCLLQDFDDDTDTSDGALSGLIHRAGQWWIRRSEERQRHRLEQQVEEQRRKLEEAEQMRDFLLFGRTLDQNPGYQQATRDPSRRPVELFDLADAPCNHIPGLPNLHIGSEKSFSTEQSDEYYDAFQENRHTRSSSMTSENRSVSVTRVYAPISTLSGDGLAVRLNVPNSLTEDLLTVEVVQEPIVEKESPFILSKTQMISLLAHDVLPSSVKFCRWKRSYSLSRDGDSFDTFLCLVANEKRSLLIVRTTRGDVFGGYAGSAWESQPHSFGANFYGSAQACLFRYLDSEKDELKVYKWTGANRYIQLCDIQNKMIAFGGGGDEGEFGLCLEDDFFRGSTGRCATFGNDPLSDQDRFEVLDLEVWSFVLAF